MKIVYFNFSAVAVLAVILISAFYRKMGTANGNRAFLICVGEVLFATIADICAVALDNLGGGHIVGKYIFHSLYLVSHSLTVLFYLVYLISLTDTWHRLAAKKYLPFLIATPALIYLVIFALNFFTPVDVFHITEDGVYTRGSWFVIGYIIAVFYTIFGIVYILRFRKLFATKTIVMLFAPYPFLFLATLIQYLRPTMTIELFFNALTLLFIYTNIQKPEELMDPITRLGNMNAFEDTTRRAFLNEKKFYTIIIDAQSYETVQEMLDFSARRTFLRRCAVKIQAIAREQGVTADCYSGRYGRFFLLIRRKDSEKLQSLSEALLRYFNENQNLQGVDVPMEAAVCVVSVPEDISTFPDYMRYVSSDLKELHSGTLQYAKELFQERYYKILLNINRIVTDAMKEQRFEVYYQPIYSCRLRRFISAEALLRLKDPEFGFVPPDVFITAAERIGVIDKISDFVLDTVCDFIASPNFSKLGLEYIEVNLSALECVHDNLPERVLNIVREKGIQAKRLALEITETALIYNPEKLKQNLDALAQAGIMFCLDDYGTGYSDTRRIIDLPLSVVKLDRSFLMGMERKFNQVIIRDTVKMMNDIGHHVVAEGVETEPALELLEKCGCDMIQGYYFSKPIPKKDFEALCAARLQSEE